MKVHIGPYQNWFGPYQLAEKLCFWVKPVKDEYGIPDKPEWVHKFGEWLAHGSIEPDPTPENPISNWDKDRPNTLLYKVLLWIESKRKRTVKVRIDKWDTWNMETTLGFIVRPMLKQLKESKHGAPFVEDKDVPKHLRSTSAPKLTQEEIDNGAVDNLHFQRWDWVLDEMIFAFESLHGGANENWETQFYSGKHDWISVATEFDENGKPKLYRAEKGPNDTSKIDLKGLKIYQKRISNGFLLFGKYYQNLWD
jgi:hypothetical protein